MNQEKIQKLEFLAQNLDPFVSQINQECLKLIQELELEDFLDRPFDLTNEILRRIHEPENKPTLH